MPNWVFNSLVVAGQSKMELQLMVEQLNKPFTVHHDSYNPKTGQMEKKETHYSNPVFAFWNIVKPTDLEAYYGEDKHKTDLNDFVNSFNTAVAKNDSWYYWNLRNWGTKWDVAISHGEEYPETELMEESETSLAYRFNTAWSPPIPAIEKLSEQYPKLHFNLSYEEETGWGGEYDYLAGEETEIENYENKCRDCDSLNTMEYCENDCGEICSECNYLGEADMDCVAECEVHSELATVN